MQKSRLRRSAIYWKAGAAACQPIANRMNLLQNQNSSMRIILASWRFCLRYYKWTYTRKRRYVYIIAEGANILHKQADGETWTSRSEYALLTRNPFKRLYTPVSCLVCQRLETGVYDRLSLVGYRWNSLVRCQRRHRLF